MNMAKESQRLTGRKVWLKPVNADERWPTLNEWEAFFGSEPGTIEVLRYVKDSIESTNPYRVLVRNAQGSLMEFWLSYLLVEEK